MVQNYLTSKVVSGIQNYKKIIDIHLLKQNGVFNIKMNKSVFSLFLLLLLMTSCEQSTLSDNEDNRMVNVNISFSDLNLTTEPITRASSQTATEAGVKRIVLSIYDLNDNLISTFTQNKETDATTFGQTISTRIPVGTYKFVAVAHSTSDASDLSATINSDSEISLGTQHALASTYSTVMTVNVEGNTTQNVTIDFKTRRNSRFVINIKDDTPSDVQKLELIVSPTANDYTDLKFDPSTGFATSTWRYYASFDKSTDSNSSFSNHKYSLSLLLTDATQTTNVTINALSSADKVLYTRTLSNVTFQQGHQTIAEGTFFSPVASTSFIFDTSITGDNTSLDE